MPNAWVEHVRKYAKDNNMSYGCAVSEAKASYVKAPRAPRKTSPPKPSPPPPKPSPPPPKPSQPSPKSFNENLKKIEDIRNNTPNGVFIRKSKAKEILTISFFSKLSLNPDDLIFDKKSNVKYLSKTDISSNYSADILKKIFKEWYDKNKIAPDTGNNIQRYYRQIPFDDLRFFEF